MFVRFANDRKGSSLPLIAVSLGAITCLVGVTLAIGADTGSGGRLQLGADSAALAGATAFLTEIEGPVTEHLARSYDAAYGIATANSAAQSAVVKVGAVTTDVYGQTAEIDVTLRARPSNIFASFGGKEDTAELARRAKATATRDFPLCILALAKDGTGVELLNSAALDAPVCAIWSNSPDSEPVTLNAASALTSRSFCVAGMAKPVKGTMTPKATNSCQTIPDPLASWTPPSVAGCDHTNFSAKVTTLLGLSLKPGVYCGGISVDARNVTMEPGVYVIKDGPLQMDVTEDLIGQEVFIVLSGDNAYTDIRVVKNASLMAPTSGPWAGMVLAEDRTTRAVDTSGVPTGAELTSEFTGAADYVIEGAIYLPNQRLNFGGTGPGTKSSPYLQMVVKRFRMTEQRQLEIRFDQAEMSVPVVIEPRREARLLD
jgi:hypothetical protein